MRSLASVIISFILCVPVSAVTVLQADHDSTSTNIEKRKLSAAASYSSIQARSDTVRLSNEVEIVYAEGLYGFEKQLQSLH